MTFVVDATATAFVLLLPNSNGLEALDACAFLQATYMSRVPTVVLEARPEALEARH